MLAFNWSQKWREGKNRKNEIGNRSSDHIQQWTMPNPAYLSVKRVQTALGLIAAHLQCGGPITHNCRPAQLCYSCPGLETWTGPDFSQVLSLGCEPQHTPPPSLRGGAHHAIFSNGISKGAGAAGPFLRLKSHGSAGHQEMDTEAQFHPFFPGFLQLCLIQRLTWCHSHINTYWQPTPCLEYPNTCCCLDTLTESLSQIHWPDYLSVDFSKLQPISCHLLCPGTLDSHTLRPRADSSFFPYIERAEVASSSQQTSPNLKPTWCHNSFIHFFIHSHSFIFTCSVFLLLPSPPSFSQPRLKIAFSNTQWTASWMPHHHSRSSGSKQSFLTSIPSTYPNTQQLTAPLSLLLPALLGSNAPFSKPILGPIPTKYE